MKKVILWLLVIAVVTGLVYIFISGGKNSQSNEANSWLSSSSSNPVLTGETMNINGLFFCLKHKGTDSDCAIGIEDSKGNDYALLDSNGKPVDPTKYTTGQNGAVFGDLAQDSALSAKYNIVGAIQLK
jgi:hypothetical protein